MTDIVFTRRGNGAPFPIRWRDNPVITAVWQGTCAPDCSSDFQEEG
ncbi:hypothetical protein KCP77_03720 [Salmonella enterica subsp. enterica]|nr:hypothetical protein KCP77_03720 [Salmonella enterica subsp. enterica]